MIEFVTRNNNKNLILFIHGFIGGIDTWNYSEHDFFPSLLLKDQKINEQYDIAHFLYFTKLLNLIAKGNNHLLTHIFLLIKYQ